MGTVAQTLRPVTQAVIGEFRTKHLVQINQRLLALNQVTGWQNPGTIVPGELIWERPSLQQIIWG
jgi:hypothetical protein